MKNLMLPREDKWGIMSLQNCILGIAEYLDHFCVSHGINYCLMGGSALGAVRHKGFIPWDDDLDVFMRPDDYLKFRQLFSQEGNHDKYYLQEWAGGGNLPSFAKLRLNSSHYCEADLEKLDIHRGVYVDIFILHTCPDNKIAHWWQYFWSRYLVIKALANRGYKRHGLFGQVLLKPLQWLPKRTLVSFALSQIYKRKDQSSKYLCHYLGRAGYKKGLYLREYFKSTKRVPFETISLCVPEKVEEYLRDRWGNYMQIPSEDEIRYYQHSSSWSVDTPFPGYNKEGKYNDEKNLIG